MISVCMLTKNSGETLREALDSVAGFSEVVILDNGSTDETLQIAASYKNVRVFEVPFIGFGPLRNQAAGLAQNDWILCLDSDERLSPALIQELGQLELNSEVAYEFPRHNFYRGKRIKGCGWDPEKTARLYHKNFAQFCDSQVHEALLAEQKKRLRSPLLHTPYRNTADFLQKMQHYSTLFALQNQGKKRSSFAKALWHGFFAFFRSYFLRRGIFCGKEGFVISLYNANTAFYKYMKLAEIKQDLFK